MTGTQLPLLTTDQMVEVDRLMIEEYGIGLLQMMENAGRSLAALARRLLGGNAQGKQIAVVCGAGNNGGGGLVAARHLSNWGARVRVVLARSPEKLKETPAHQWRALSRLPVERAVFDPASPPAFNHADLILDALIGYGLRSNPRGATADLIRLINASGQAILALDAPSGLDTTAGVPGDPCIKADATLTLALPKVGLATEQARAVVGDLYLADISVPPSLYRRLGIELPPLFATDTIIRLS
ncbi:MAG TPA: NAD(P)H-hydrate epimerase [Chloroflexi bacterium]|nr:NAD(P)H-hydrate epimerase [Chloroflexota bacterium]